jgi:hypothetical protein
MSLSRDEIGDAGLLAVAPPLTRRRDSVLFKQGDDLIGSESPLARDVNVFDGAASALVF